MIEKFEYNVNWCKKV